jgi:hypothetical protein
MEHGHRVLEAALRLGGTGHREADPAEPAELCVRVLLGGQAGSRQERRDGRSRHGDE